MSTLPFHDHASLSTEERTRLARTFGEYTTLAQVLEWGRDLRPPVVVDEIIAMDEYSHDVLVRLPGGNYLAFDTT